jgi:hypothetical protein
MPGRVIGGINGPVRSSWMVLGRAFGQIPRATTGVPHGGYEHHEEFQAQKEAAEKKKKTTITAKSFDKQVAHKMGKFFDEVFLPSLKKLVEARRSYEDVKRLVKIPGTWGAKITGEQFEDRVNAYFSK